MLWFVGTSGAAPPSSVSWDRVLQDPVSWMVGTGGAGRAGTDVFGLLASAGLRAPTVDRRHLETLGTAMPKRSATSLSCDVWSKTCETTFPPRLNGEIPSAGTRTPRQSGPAMPSAWLPEPGSRECDG